MVNHFFRFLLLFLRACCTRRSHLIAENLMLRQQLRCLQLNGKRPTLKSSDRLFWVLMKRWRSDWRSTLLIVQPETVCRWHRVGFRLFWRWKSGRGKMGRPQLDAEVRQLIRQMSRDNVTWGATRIRQELMMLGYRVAKSTVAKYMVRHCNHKNPSPTWKAFLKNHGPEILACDFFTVPSLTFRTLYCFVVLHHATRRVLHFNVTAHPTAEWTGRQIAEAVPADTTMKYLLCDNDKIYGKAFQQCVKSCNLEEVRTTYRSPWQNAHCERVIGSIRRECLKYLVVLGERHLRRTLTDYFLYYNEHRTHQGLEGQTPQGREREPPDDGEAAVPGESQLSDVLAFENSVR